MAGPSYGDILRQTRRAMANPPEQGLTGGRPPRVTTYNGFVRVLGLQLGSGHHLGVVTEHDAATDTFADRDDVPVWIRTPRKEQLQTWFPGCPDGVGVYWGRAQDLITLAGGGVTGTGTGTEGTLVTGTGIPDDGWRLPLYIVDDCCPDVNLDCAVPDLETVPCANVAGGEAAAEWEVTIAGLTGTDCTVYNGTHVLVSSGTCTWLKTLQAGITIDLAITSPFAAGILTLNFVATNQIVFRKNSGVSGVDPFVANYFSDTGGCGGIPASVTISPVV